MKRLRKPPRSLSYLLATIYSRSLVRAAFFNPRRKSLARGNVLVIGSLIIAVLISHAPHLQPSLWLILPTLTMMIGTGETVRCMQKRWSFYHGGVLLCIYMDLMALAMAFFFLLYPYFFWITATH
jgi:hypothetical protein